MNRRLFSTTCLIAAGQAWRAWRARADDLESDKPSTGYPNALAPTLGGRQFWADELFYHEWHVQRNALTGHCRLLDGSNVRHAWGSFEECCAKLERIKRERSLPPMRGPAVVVLHGLFRSAASMAHISRYLREKGDYSVFNMNYPTTRGELAEHARVLDKVIRNLEGIEEINFVAHSLGNLVVRHYLGDHTNPEVGTRPDDRIKRIVMLGPPNQGAQLAEALGANRMVHFVAGPSVGQMGRNWEKVATKLATPACPFGILAGGRGTDKGYNPWLGKDNDLVVSVETTRLDGAADFAVLPVVHTLMMDDPVVQQYTLRFLKHGYFVSPDERHPLGPNDPAPA